MAEGSVLIRSGRGKRAFAGEVSVPAGLGGNLADNQLNVLNNREFFAILDFFFKNCTANRIKVTFMNFRIHNNTAKVLAFLGENEFIQ